MKRKFTYLLTAFTLLAFLSPTLAWGGVKLSDNQRVTQKATHETTLGEALSPMNTQAPERGEGMTREVTYEQLQSIASIDESAQYVLGLVEGNTLKFHYEGTSSWGKVASPSSQTPIYYTLTKASDGDSFTAQATISGTTYYLQIPTSNTFGMATSTSANTDIIIGTTQVSETNYAVANKTTTARHLRINGTSGLRSYAGTTGTMAFFYKVVQPTTPTINVNPSSINWDNSPINVALSQEITVSQTNLTGDISASTTIGQITWNTQNQSATLTYTPAETGDFSGTITFANDETTATVAVTGSAYDPEDVDTYELYTGNLTEGDYVVVYSGVALTNTVSSNRLGYTSVSISNDVISNPASSIIWHIAQDGDYWTIYNDEVEKYAVSNGTKNQADLSTTLDDKARWTVSGTETFDFTNKNNSVSSINATLRYNSGYGFACYSTSTGGALSLYKLNNANQVATPSFSPAAGTYNATQSVEISCTTAGATIYYTTDGTTPSATNGTTYSEAITVATTTTIKAIAVKDGMEDSQVATAEYTITLPTVETPTFSPAAGTYTSAQNVTITCATTGATIYYTTDGTTPTTSSSVYISAIEVSQNMTIKAMATATGYENSAVAEAAYTIVNIEHAGTEADPYTVADARNAIDVYGTIDEAYVAGIVCQVDSYNSNYSSITYWISDDGTTATMLQVYSGKDINGADFTSIDDIQVNDQVVVKGELKMYNSTYEFNYNNELVSLVRPTQPEIVINAEVLALSYEADENGSFAVTYSDFTVALASATLYSDAECTTVFPTSGDDAWILLDGMEDPYTTINYIALANPSATERTAYMKVEAMDEDENMIYAVFVITQAAAPQQYTMTVGTLTHVTELFLYNAEDESNPIELDGNNSAQVLEGTVINVSVDVEEGYVLESLTVTDVNDTQLELTEIEPNVYYSFTMPASNVTITATAVEAPVPGNWVLTDLADLTPADVFVIVGDNGDTYALSNNNGTSSAPAAVEVTEVDGTLSGEIPAYIQWNISGNATDGYTFYPAGSATTWLYCTNTNNGVRVGTNSNKVFKYVDGGTVGEVQQDYYLQHVGTSRYVGIYNSQDWRCYESINDNIKNQSFSFYKKVSDPITRTKQITKYEGDGGYYLIASPVASVTPSTENGFLNGTPGAGNNTYDLYSFDQSQSAEWCNYETQPFNLVSGKGYLYANGETNGTTLTFIGQPYNGNGLITLDYNENAAFAGWNLIGNPFDATATLNVPFYRLNTAGDALNATTESGNVDAMEGVFVQATATIRTATFTEPQNNGDAVESQAVPQVNIMVSRSRGASVVDNAIVRFDGGSMLGKFQLNANSTKLSIPQGGKDYAIVNAQAEGEMPVSFRAAENGTYTLTVNPENVEMEYLHLIDNMTGADVDLLATPSYTFEAKTSDYASRFRLVFSANNVDENGASTGSATFAYFNGTNWTISNMGEATLQVVDVMGRVLSSETLSGNATVSLNQAQGVYMLRLVNGNDVKVQKVVVQ